MIRPDDASANRRYVADRIRSADPGKHEWIPAGHVGEVIAKLIEKKGPSAAETEAAAEWIDAIDALRTPTDEMVLLDVEYDPDAEGDVEERIRPAYDGDGDKGSAPKQPTDLRRHPPQLQGGAIKQMIEPFHQILRDFFDEQFDQEQPPTPEDFVEKLTGDLIPKLLWDGKFQTDAEQLGSDVEGAEELAALQLLPPPRGRRA